MASTSNEAVKPQSSASTSNQLSQEYVVRIPKTKMKNYNVMRFNNSHKVNVAQWTHAKMERENNMKEFKAEEDLPKYGAGSEFGREQREESRRKKYGIISKKYNPDDQPWILKLNGKTGKKYKGIREGGVTENASYYVFTQAADGTFEAHPVAEWYNFTPIQRYKALSAEEAEEEFGRRDKVLNYFSIMVNKRLQKVNIEEDDEDGEKKVNKKKGQKKKQSKEFKITDMDDWARDSSDDSEKEGEGEDDDDAPKKPQKKGKEKKNKEDVDDEGKEESDEGDFDDREVDYITGSSSSEAEVEDEKANRQLKGVEDEEALRTLDASDEEEEQEENKEEEENKEQEKPADQPNKQKKKKEGKKEGDSSGDSSSDTSDSDLDDNKVHALFMQKQAKKTGSDNSAGSSRANTPTRLNADAKDGNKGLKRKMVETSTPPTAKKPRAEGQSSSATVVTSLDGINEEAIRRYLSRKPMTASELLYKFKSKKSKLSSDQLVTKIADLLKRMDLVKRNIKGKMYLSLKT